MARDDWATVKGYYRLIGQPEDFEVTPAHVLAPHRAGTRRRMQAQATVLCLQDGIDLNVTTRPQTRGIAVIGRNQTGAESLGLHLHSTLAVNADGLLLGVLEAQFEAPQPRGDEEPAQEEKKSFRWIAGLCDAAALVATLPNTRVVTGADPEADAFDLYAEQQPHPALALVIRAQRKRRRADGRRSFDVARVMASRGSVELPVDAQSLRTKTSKRPERLGRSARTAELELRYNPVTLRGTPAGADPPVTLELTVAHALERDPPKAKSRSSSSRSPHWRSPRPNKPTKSSAGTACVGESRTGTGC